MLTTILIILIAAAIVAFIAWPLINVTRRQNLSELDVFFELSLRRDAALKAVKDLEFDFQTGKISAEDFPAYDRLARQQAIFAIKAVDDYLSAHSPSGSVSSELEDAFEAEIASYRKQTSSIKNDAFKFCPQCGQPIVPTDRYCRACGVALNAS